MKFIDSSAKTNWKFLAIFIFLSTAIGVVVTYYFLTQKPEEQKVEKIVYTKAAWAEDVGRVRTLIVANKDGIGRKVLLEKMPNEYPGISASTLLIPERNEVVIVIQSKYYPYDLDIEKIHTESGQRTKLATYKEEGGGHGMSLVSAIFSPDKKKIAFTIRKHLFTIDITNEKLVALKPFYTDTQSREGESIAPVFWDLYGNIYLKSFAGRPEENRINDFVKVSSQGKREELSQEHKAFFKTPSSDPQVVGFHLYPSPDGKFAAWIIPSSEENTPSQKVLVYSVEKRFWFVRLKKDSIQLLENEEAIHFQKERLNLPSQGVEMKGGSKEDIGGAQLYIDDVLIDSIREISVGWGHGDAFEILGFVSGTPIAGLEKDSQETERDHQEAEFQAFKKISLYPEYVSSGWVKESERGHGFGIMLEFRNAKSDSLSIYQDSFSIFQEKQDAQIPQEFYVFRDYVSHYPKNRITTQENVSIGSSSGLYFTGDYLEQVLAWSAEGLDIGILCAGGCSLTKEELIKIANSMKPITTLQQGSKQAELTAGWQTYRNDEFGFEARYPKGWVVTGEGGIENQQTNSSLSIIKNNNPKNFSLDEWFREATLINGRPTIKAEARPVTINGVKAYRLDTELPPPNPYFEIVGIADEQRHIFTIHADYKVLEDGGILDQILATFRFTPTPKPVSTRVAREITITAKKNQWRFVPEEFEVNQGDTVLLTVLNEDDYDHGIAIDQFGISKRIPANSTTKFEFMATQAGDIPFYSSVPSGGGIVDGEKRTHYDMVGKIHVRSLIPETK